jgi:hypothetical protein
MSSIWNELVYRARSGWVRTKDILGFPRTGTDRSFYVAQLVRNLRSGKLGRNVRITAAGKSDGAGAQAQAVASAIAFANAFGLDYVHTPFRHVCHAEGPINRWTEGWEKNLSFGSGYAQVDTCGLPVIPLGDFLKDRSLWNKDCVVQLIHYQHWTSRNPSAYVPLVPRLRESYYRNKVRGPNERRVVAVHIRRGDVTPTQSGKTHFTPNAPIVATLQQVVALLQERGETPVIRIFSQGKPEDFKDFSAFGPEFHLDEPAMWTFHQLVEADVLIMARSAFSYVAALLSEGIKLYDPMQEQPLPDWIVRDTNGNFDAAAFGDQWSRLLSRPRANVAAPDLDLDRGHQQNDFIVARQSSGPRA